MTTLFFLLSLIPSASASQGTHWYDTVNPKLAGVPHCVYGSMTLKDNMWLVGADGVKVDFHALMGDSSINGVPESTPIDADIAVCQNGWRLIYSVK